jgi:polyhydroxybutyrate depolymerase
MGSLEDTTLTITSGGLTRTADVHVPPGYDPAKGAPLAMTYHFAGGTPELMALTTSLNAAADARGFIVVYPAGVGGSWNAGGCCGPASVPPTVDDIGFTRDLLAAIEQAYCVDPHRVFATGLSNGALMVERVGCELGDRFAAIAPVAGVIDIPVGREGLRPICRREPVSVFEVHGTGDTSMPYNGGLGMPPVPVTGNLNFISVPRNIELWRKKDECSPQSRVVYQKGDTTCVAWSNCEDESTAELCTIDGGGHTWPSGFVPPLFGKTSTDLDASGAILDFFAAHSRD